MFNTIYKIDNKEFDYEKYIVEELGWEKTVLIDKKGHIYYKLPYKTRRIGTLFVNLIYTEKNNKKLIDEKPLKEYMLFSYFKEFVKLNLDNKILSVNFSFLPDEIKNNEEKFKKMLSENIF